MARQTFDQIWVPRIGREAANELRRNARVTTITMFPLLPLAIACSFAFGSGSTVGTALGLILVLMATTGFAVWIRSRQKVADAVGRWFGVPIRWSHMPTMRSAEKFDVWCDQQGFARQPT
jgi:hypothetical protein